MSSGIIAAPGSPGPASDFVGSNMNTWDVARIAITDYDNNNNNINNKEKDNNDKDKDYNKKAVVAELQAGSSSLLLSSSSPSREEQSNHHRPEVLDSLTPDPSTTDRLCAFRCACKPCEEEPGEEVEEDVAVQDSGMEEYSSGSSGDMTDLEPGQLLFAYGAMSVVDADFNSTFNESLNDGNDTLDNNTYVLGGLYPSGYGLPHIIFASIVVTLLMIVIVVGNMLVIIAIATEKALKNIQNWFIASLAVADFFLGLVIMPFSLANEIMGYWIFGYWWCDIHSAMDVLLCTASIMNLCLISLDRFWSITQAVEYLKRRTPMRAAIMIAMVWVLSAVICIPPLLGWKRNAPEEEFPKCKVRLRTLVYTSYVY